MFNVSFQCYTKNEFVHKQGSLLYEIASANDNSNVLSELQHMGINKIYTSTNNTYHDFPNQQTSGLSFIKTNKKSIVFCSALSKSTHPK